MRSAVVPLVAGLLLVACGDAEPTSTPGVGGLGVPASEPASDDADATTTVVAPDGTDADPDDTQPDETPPADTELHPETTPSEDEPPADTSAPGDTAAPPDTSPPATDAPVPSGPVGDVAAANPSKSWWFVGTEEGDPEAMSDGAKCQGLYEAQGLGTLTYSQCGPWESFDGSYMWTVAKGATDRFQAIVWQQTADPFTWIPKMKLVEPLDDSGSVPSGWGSVTMLVADMDSGPAEELLAGVTLEGTGAFVFFDVIDVRSGDPRPVATVHDLDRGRVLPDSGVGVAFYTPIALDAEPNCCPTTWDQFLLADSADGWAVADVASGVLTADVPAGAL